MSRWLVGLDEAIDKDRVSVGTHPLRLVGGMVGKWACGTGRAGAWELPLHEFVRPQ